jgi:methyl-accepting chemotaxis protein
MSYKTEIRITTLGAAVGDAFSLLESLAEEVREVVDNASDGLSQTQRIQTLEETASTLENLQEPEVPEWLRGTEVTYVEQVQKDKRRGPSRAARCENATRMLRAAQEVVTQRLEAQEAQVESEAEEVQELLDSISNAADDAESAEFPGMYG